MYTLSIDVGNTLAKAGLFKENTLIHTFEKLNEEQLLACVIKYDPAYTIICSVGRNIENIENLLKPYTQIICFTHNTPIPIQNLYTTPHTLGMDRLAGAIGAQCFFPKKNCLVIDAGTCLTYDFINEQEQYLGGSISLGIDIRFRALHEFTAKLPSISPTYEKPSLIGSTTSSAMVSGVLNGILAEVTGIIESYKNQYNALEVIFCGGNAFFFETNIKTPIFVNVHLVLFGLNRILQYNVEKI